MQATGCTSQRPGSLGEGWGGFRFLGFRVPLKGTRMVPLSRSKKTEFTVEGADFVTSEVLHKVSVRTLAVFCFGLQL